MTLPPRPLGDAGGAPDAPEDSAWVFGYGSLIWRADFPVIERIPARLHGWSRRFWQGSHDHRGTPEAPGRVLTLVRTSGATCAGVAYRVRAKVLGHLDVREQNGYQRSPVRLRRGDGTAIDAWIYIAEPGNLAWLGDAPAAAIADQIRRASGPSGRNAEYLLRLAAALRELGEDDPHVFELERLLLGR